MNDGCMNYGWMKDGLMFYELWMNDGWMMDE
jgi:hypothetical protein